MKPTKESHKRYTQEFKVTAVRLALHDQFQTQDVAEALGIHPFMLSRWKKEYKDGVLKGKSHEEFKQMEEKVAEQAKLREMEQRIQALEKENEVLKKSIQFVSKKSQTSSSS